MGARTQEINVDSEDYSTTQYTATKGVKLLAKLSKVIGKPLSAMAANGDITADTDVATQNIGLIAAAVSALGESIDEDSVVALIKEILETTLYKNVPINFDIHFAGRYRHLFNLLKSVLSFQYADFLAESPSALGASRMAGRR